MRRILIYSVAALSFFLGPPSFAYQFISGDEQVAVLELYTSEGCSSCPPADAWVSELKSKDDLWGRYVVLGFHVNYWDYLGWKDSFSSEIFVERQKQYVQGWNTGALYTPAVVLNGRPWKGWRERGELPAIERPVVGNLRISTSDYENFSYQFTPPGDSPEADFEASLAVIGFNLTSDVTKGENSGKTLAHDFVVLSLQASKKMSFEGGQATAEFTIDKALARQRSASIGIVGWVSYRDTPVPLQATGGMIDV